MSYTPSKGLYGKKSGAKLREMARNSSYMSSSSPAPSSYSKQGNTDEYSTSNSLDFSGILDSYVSAGAQRSTYARKRSLLQQSSGSTAEDNVPNDSTEITKTNSPILEQKPFEPVNTDKLTSNFDDSVFDLPDETDRIPNMANVTIGRRHKAHKLPPLSSVTKLSKEDPESDSNVFEAPDTAPEPSTKPNIISRAMERRAKAMSKYNSLHRIPNNRSMSSERATTSLPSSKRVSRASTPVKSTSPAASSRISTSRSTTPLANEHDKEVIEGINRRPVTSLSSSSIYRVEKSLLSSSEETSSKSRSSETTTETTPISNSVPSFLRSKLPSTEKLSVNLSQSELAAKLSSMNPSKSKAPEKPNRIKATKPAAPLQLAQLSQSLATRSQSDSSTFFSKDAPSMPSSQENPRPAAVSSLSEGSSTLPKPSLTRTSGMIVTPRSRTSRSSLPNNVSTSTSKTSSRKRSLPASMVKSPIKQATLNSFFGTKSNNAAISKSAPVSTNNSESQISEIEKDAWLFLGNTQISPPNKKKRRVSQFSSLSYNSDSESEGDDDNMMVQDTQTVYSSDIASNDSQGMGISSSTSASQSSSKWSSARPTYSSMRGYGAGRSYLAEESRIQPSIDASSSRDGDQFGFMDQLGLTGSNDLSSNSENESEPEDELEYGGHIKTAQELRATGGNAKFTDEIQYILDGLEDKTSRRSSLLELCERCLSSEFVQDLRVSSVPAELFSAVRGETDGVSTFLIAFLICALLSGEERHAGLAAALVSSYGIVDLLIAMIDDTKNIMRLVNRRESGSSKMFKISFADTLQKFRVAFFNPTFEQKILKNNDKEPSVGQYDGLVLSRSLVALTALAALQNQDEKVNMFFCDQVVQKKLLSPFFEVGKGLQEELLPFSDHTEWKYDPSEATTNEEDDKEVFQEYFSNLHLLNMVCAQIEYLFQNRFEAALTALEIHETGGSGDNFFLSNLFPFFENLIDNYWAAPTTPPSICTSYNPIILRSLKVLSVTYLKIMILVTSNVAYKEVMSDKHSRRGRLFSKIYSPQRSCRILQFLYNLDLHQESPTLQNTQQINDRGDIDDNNRNKLAILDNNTELFSWGLLVNLCESESVSFSFYEDEWLQILKQFLQKIPENDAKNDADDDSELQETQLIMPDDNDNSHKDSSEIPNTSSEGYLFHVRGYQLLVLGLLLTFSYKSNGDHKEFSKEEQNKIKAGLENFQQNLANKLWGQGLRNQIIRVLETIKEKV